MMSQQAVFAETIVCMKKAIKRKAYDSESDSSIDRCTNRGNKLRKKARFVRRGQLAPPSGSYLYRRTVEHAGHTREILSRNPPLLDEDGYAIDSDDDQERTQAAMVTAAQFNPYAQVKLEHLLAPLTSASELPNHPTLSKPFTSHTLTYLTYEARDMVQKEKNFLWKLKHLMTRMSGDNTWIPCRIVEGDDDWTLFFNNQNLNQNNFKEKVESKEERCQVSGDEALTTAEKNSPDFIIAAVKHLIAKEKQDRTENANKDCDRQDPVLVSNSSSTSKQDKLEDLNSSAAEKSGLIDNLQSGDIDIENDCDRISVSHHMRTRAQVQAQLDNTTTKPRSTSPDPSFMPSIHPYFLASKTSQPDRNFGLPQNEATETRRVLQLYIQKQEEVCRGIQKIYDGLLKADRCRKLIMKWAKADGHAGINRDMSDGEDWYDNEEWKLDEDLKKGQDEEDEDPVSTAKKTRTRRQ